MSWLTGLAGKAEHLLNNIDQAAGQALHVDDATKHSEHERQSFVSASQRDPYSPYLSQKSTLLAQNKSQLPSSPSNLMSTSVSVPSNLNRMDGDHSTSADMSQMSASMYSPSSSSTQLSKAANNKRDKDEDLFAFLNNPDVNNGSKKKATVKNVNGKHSRHSSTSSTQSSKSTKVAENVPNMETIAAVTPSDKSGKSTP